MDNAYHEWMKKCFRYLIRMEFFTSIFGIFYGYITYKGFFCGEKYDDVTVTINIL